VEHKDGYLECSNDYLKFLLELSSAFAKLPKVLGRLRRGADAFVDQTLELWRML
jgi:hypothetical protein